MDERAPIIRKRATGLGFDPQLQVTPGIAGLADRIIWTDGSLARFEVHPDWLAQVRRDAQILNAHASTSIEGNPLTLQEASRIAAHPLPTTDPHSLEILQHLDFFRDLRHRVGTPDEPLTTKEIEETHRDLLRGVLRPDLVGLLRGPAHPVDVYFGANEGTAPGQVEAELQALNVWLEGPGRALPAPVRIAIWFHEFESIHPFSDGNGRVGRALTHRLLATHGLPNSLYVALDAPFNEDRRAYYAALDSVRISRRYEAWVNYFLECLWTAYTRSHQVLKRVTSVPAGFEGAERAILEHLLRTGEQHLRVAPLVRALEVYKPITITVALRSLQTKHGLVQHNGGRGRGSAYTLTPAFEALTKAPRLIGS